VHTGSRLWGRHGQLVILQSWKFGSDLIVSRVNRSVAKAGSGCNRPAICIVQSGVEKVSFATHFQDGHQRIPIGHSTPTARPGVEIVTQEAKSVRNERCSGTAISVESLAVE